MTNLNSARVFLTGARTRPWLVPPLVLPIAFGIMIAAYALYRVLI